MKRISELYRYDSMLNRINQAKEMTDRIHENAVSGRKIHHLSDDPIASVKLMKNRAKISNIEQFRRNQEFADSFLSKTEDSLLSINDSLIRAKELAIQQANSTYDIVSKKAVATEIKQLIEHVINLGNTTYSDRYVFGGFQSSFPPIAPDGSYLGDDGVIFIQIDEDCFAPINVNGRGIFDVPIEKEGVHKPLIQTLRGMVEALESNDSEGLYRAMTDIDNVTEQILTATASLGARRSAISNGVRRLDNGEVSLYADNNALEGNDMIKSALDLQRSSTALEYTLQSSQKTLAPSLLNFLK